MNKSVHNLVCESGKRLAVATAMLALAGCALPSQTIKAIEAVEPIAEREVDATVRFAVSRLCELKVDILARASVDSDKARAMFWACPELRALLTNVMQSVSPGSAGWLPR